MLSPGDGIALAGVCVLAMRFIPAKGRNNCRTSDVCSEHSGIVANIGELVRDVGEIKADIKTLLSRNG